jgi:NAD(P)-dependent dehydrogenase (short-subunit alcohol dehydrogenase family)
VLGALLDRSIVFSFDRTGYRRHARAFPPGELEVDASGRVAIVTGASSGIGIEIARGLLARGAEVVLAVRDVDKGERVRAELGAIGARASVCRLDVSDLASVRRFASELPHERLDVLVHNAGSLVDRETRTPDGLEVTVATHLVGPFLLSHLLWPRLRASSDARLIHVASGGLYAERLDVATLFDGEGSFDGVRQYARAKRAQLVVTEEIARRAREGGAPVAVSAMHPGWADTPGVRTALPRFFAITRAILRTPAEGADTVLFLALAARARDAGGRFFFDRAAVPAHLRASTHEPSGERERLWARLVAITGLPEDAFG